MGGGLSRIQPNNTSFLWKTTAPQWEAGEGVCGQHPALSQVMTSKGRWLSAPSLPHPRPLPYSLLCHVALLSTLAEQEVLREGVGPSFIAVLGTKPGPHGNVCSERTARGLPARDVYPGRAPVSQGATRPGRESRQWVAGLNSRAFCCHLIPNPLSRAQGKGEKGRTSSRQRRHEGEDHTGWRKPEDLVGPMPLGLGHQAEALGSANSGPLPECWEQTCVGLMSDTPGRPRGSRAVGQRSPWATSPYV